MKKYLETRQLRYFRAVAGNGSLSGAARSLNISQSALSYNIAELEAQIGTRLLDRHRSGVCLTEAGGLLLHYATRMAEIAEQAECDLLSSAGRSQEKTRLRLGIISSLAASLAPLVAVSAAEKLPSTVLGISETSTVNSVRLLEEGKLDAAIHLVQPAGFKCIPLASERLFCVSRAVGAVALGPISLTELSRMDLVLPARGNPLRDLLEKEAAAAGVRLKITLEIDGWAPRRNAILAGLGTTVLGTYSVIPERRYSQLMSRDIVRPALHRPIYLCLHPDLDHRLAEQLQEMLRIVFSRPEFRLPNSQVQTEPTDSTTPAGSNQQGEDIEI